MKKTSFCPKCNARLTNKANYCPICGPDTKDTGLERKQAPPEPSHNVPKREKNNPSNRD